MKAPTEELVSILLVDDHAVVREGLRALLDRQLHLRVVAEAGTAAEALAVRDAPDVVVADLMLPDCRDGSVVADLRRAFPDTRILVLTMLGSTADVGLALALGADGYLTKDAAATRVVEAIDTIVAGRRYVGPTLSPGGIDTTVSEARRARPLTVLTKREQDVLALLSLGYTNSEIARNLYVGVRTVEGHRANIVRKVGLRTRAELTRYAAESGLLQSSRPRIERHDA